MEKMEESLVAKFHNQKEPDFDTETGRLYEAGEEGFERHQDFLLKTEEKKSNNGNENQEEIPEFENQIDNLLATIENVQLNPLYRGDEEQQRLLEQKKDQAKKLIKKVLDDITEYMKTVDHSYRAKMERGDVDQDVF